MISCMSSSGINLSDVLYWITIPLQYQTLQIVRGGKLLRHTKFYFNSLEDFHSYMPILYNQSPLYKLLHWKSFAITD